jgi:preprotein translocase subunit SecF
MSKLTGTPGVDRRHRPSDFYHERTNFRFMAHMRRYLIVFLVVVIGGLVLVAVRGLNFGIDFTGGVSWQVDVAKGVNPKVTEVRDIVSKAGVKDFKATIGTNPQNGRETIRVQARVVDDPSTQLRKALAAATGKSVDDVTFTRQGNGGELSVDKVKAPNQDAITTAMQKVAAEGSNPKVTVDKGHVVVTVDALPSSTVDKISNELLTYAKANQSDLSISTVGPTWGSQVSRKAIEALIVFFLVLAALGTVFFEFKMAIAAIVAVLHDIIFTAAAYAVMQFVVSPATVTAFLTILGFSLYDTVVVFDKIRENQSMLVSNRNMTYGDMANRSLNQVLMRSLSTSFVALMPVVSLLVIGAGIMGATALEDFALALLAGLFIGTYSSIFVATPLFVWWKEREPQYRALKERAARSGGDTTPPAAARKAAPRLVPVADDRAVTNGGAVAVAENGAAENGSADAPAASTPSEWDSTGVPGPPAVGRSPVAPRPRQQRGKKRKR